MQRGLQLSEVDGVPIIEGDIFSANFGHYIRHLDALDDMLQENFASCQLQWKLFVAVVKSDNWLDRLDDAIFLPMSDERLFRWMMSLSAIKQTVAAIPDLGQVQKYIEEDDLDRLYLDDLRILRTILGDRPALKFHKLKSSRQIQLYNILPNKCEGLVPDAIFLIGPHRLHLDVQYNVPYERRYAYFGGEIEDLFYIAHKHFKHYRNDCNNQNGKELKLATTMNLAFKHFKQCNKPKLFSMSKNDAVYLIVCEFHDLTDKFVYHEQRPNEFEIFARDSSYVWPCYLLAFNLEKFNAAMKSNEPSWIYGIYDWFFNRENGKVTRFMRFLSNL